MLRKLLAGALVLSCGSAAMATPVITLGTPSATATTGPDGAWGLMEADTSSEAGDCKLNNLANSARVIDNNSTLTYSFDAKFSGFTKTTFKTQIGFQTSASKSSTQVTWDLPGNDAWYHFEITVQVSDADFAADAADLFNTKDTHVLLASNGSTTTAPAFTFEIDNLRLYAGSGGTREDFWLPAEISGGTTTTKQNANLDNGDPTALATFGQTILGVSPNRGQSFTVTAAAIPEPGSLALLGLGGLALLRRRA